MSDGRRYQHIIAAVRATPWAILPTKMAEIMAFLSVKAHGGDIDPLLVAQLSAAAKQRPKLRANGDIAVLPLMGTISHRMGLLSEMSGGTSVEALTQDFRTMIHDPAVAAIVLDVDSPGGSVSGIDELASEIYQARGIKPISAVSNTMMASAAYWLASAADEIVVTPSGEVGSIGVIAAHSDESALYEQLGVKMSLITAGKYKAENNPFEPLSDEGRAAIQARVDDSYALFTKAVARGRGVGLDAVRTGFGEGRMVGARDAVRLGMADRIATLDDVVATIGRRRVSTPVQQDLAALSDAPPLTFENQSEAVLAAAQTFQDRVTALAALRADRTHPFSQGKIARFAEHRDVYRALASAYDALLRACDPSTSTRHPEARALEIEFLAIEARLNGVDLSATKAGHAHG